MIAKPATVAFEFHFLGKAFFIPYWHDLTVVNKISAMKHMNNRLGQASIQTTSMN